MEFEPRFEISAQVATSLMEIERCRQQVEDLPLSPQVLARLHETARLQTTHYSTQIEGNRLTEREVAAVLYKKGHFPGRERDEAEVKGYYVALSEVERLEQKGGPISEQHVQKLHAMAMGRGRRQVKPTPYRDGQNVIRDGSSGAIVYLPPEQSDVGPLMQALIGWINSVDLPKPLIAALAHYQFATIHPYYDGNGRTARLLTTLILHKGGYGLKGIYSLEEYYARQLGDYYAALNVGPTHNYYDGRADANLTAWVEYVCSGMAHSCQKIVSSVRQELPSNKRKAYLLCLKQETLTSKDIELLFHFKPRTARQLCQRWVDEGFLEMANPSKKGRTYTISSKYSL